MRLLIAADETRDSRQPRSRSSPRYLFPSLAVPHFVSLPLPVSLCLTVFLFVSLFLTLISLPLFLSPSLPLSRSMFLPLSVSQFLSISLSLTPICLLLYLSCVYIIATYFLNQHSMFKKLFYTSRCENLIKGGH